MIEFIEINSIEYIDKEEIVNDLTVSNNHTYIANNILVHNCYQGCTPKGEHADLRNVKFFDTLHPYTELALTGNHLSHPDLIPSDVYIYEGRVIRQKEWDKSIRKFERGLDFEIQMEKKNIP